MKKENKGDSSGLTAVLSNQGGPQVAAAGIADESKRRLQKKQQQFKH